MPNDEDAFPWEDEHPMPEDDPDPTPPQVEVQEQTTITTIDDLLPAGPTPIPPPAAITPADQIEAFRKMIDDVGLTATTPALFNAAYPLLGKAIGKDMLYMIRNSASNLTMQGIFMAKCGVELLHEGKLRSLPELEEAIGKLPKPPPPAPTDNVAVAFEAQYERVETGNCHYRCRAQSTEMLHITVEDIDDLLANSEDADELHEAISNMLNVKVSEAEVDYEEVEDSHEYNDHEMRDSDDYGSHIPNSDNVRRAVINYIRHNNPTAAEDLGL